LQSQRKEKKNKFLKMPDARKKKKQMTVDKDTKDKICTGYNSALLQWLVVDGLQQCGCLIRIAADTSDYRQTYPPLQAMRKRYAP